MSPRPAGLLVAVRSAAVLSALLWLGLAGVGARGEAPVFTVDDVALRTRFQQELEVLLESGTLPKGADLLPLWLKKSEKSSPLKIEAPTGLSAGKSLTSPEIYDIASRGTVMVGHLYQCGKCDKWHPGIAGGVVIDSSGIVVTNYHVIESPKAEVFGVMTMNGELFPLIEVLVASKADDLAVVRLKTEGRKLDAVPVAPGDDPVGSEVRVISHPDGRFFTYSEGIVARYYFDQSAKAPRLQITADYAKGSSGCGVFNDRGELTGLVSSTNSIYYTEENGDQKNLQMVVKSCIPAASVRKLLDGGKGE